MNMNLIIYLDHQKPSQTNDLYPVMFRILKGGISNGLSDDFVVSFHSLFCGCDSFKICADLLLFRPFYLWAVFVALFVRPICWRPPVSPSSESRQPLPLTPNVLGPSLTQLRCGLWHPSWCAVAMSTLPRGGPAMPPASLPSSAGIGSPLVDEVADKVRLHDEEDCVDVGWRDRGVKAIIEVEE